MAAGGKRGAGQTKSWKAIQTQVQSLTRKAQEIKAKNEQR